MVFATADVVVVVQVIVVTSIVVQSVIQRRAVTVIGGVDVIVIYRVKMTIVGILDVGAVIDDCCGMEGEGIYGLGLKQI